MDDLGLFASVLGHIGDGNFHESILYDKNIPGERDKVEACVNNMVARALEMEGTCTVRLGELFIQTKLKLTFQYRVNTVSALARSKPC